MKTPKVLHREAMNFYDKTLASISNKSSNEIILENANNALNLELEAINTLNNYIQETGKECNYTLQVLYQSAATIAILIAKYGSINDWFIAQDLVNEGLKYNIEPLTTMKMEEMKTEIDNKLKVEQSKNYHKL